MTSEDVEALRDLVRRRPEAIDGLREHVARVVADMATWQDVVVPGGPLAVPLPEVMAEVGRRIRDGDLDEVLPLLLGDIATVGYRDVLGGLPSKGADLVTRLDPLPDPESRVTLGSERDPLGMRRSELHWELSPLDKWSAIRTLEILGEELGQAGVGRVRVGLDEDDDWPADLAGGWHHMGTTRMSTDPRQGVVDPGLSGARDGGPVHRWKLGVPDCGLGHANDDHRRAGTPAGRPPEGAAGMSEARHPFRRGRCTRRRFLRASVASTAIVSSSILAGATFRNDAGASTAERLAALLPAASAAAIGRAYLATGPEVADLEGIATALREKVPALSGSDQSSDRRLRELVDTRSRADFGDGDVVRVGGWILARTEVLLCAYVALVRDGASA